MARIVVAMSGGVDSSVAAALLVSQGHEVIGMMMRLWSEPGNEDQNRCCTPDALAQARRVANQLKIPFYAVDARTVFYDQIVKEFISSYKNGDTPNPCINCNRHIRWSFLLENVLKVNADYMATGHYVRLSQKDNLVRIRKGVDPSKDQSYVLHVLTQAQLQHAMFPLGDYLKSEVRQIARDFNLPVAERPESQDLCFLGNSNYREFLERNEPTILNPGPILSIDEKVLGEHKGLAFYTIGQRKGLPIQSQVPMFVVKKDPIKNALIVATLDNLGQNSLIAGNVNWIDGREPASPLSLLVKIRYKSHPVRGLVSPLRNNQVHIHFENNLRDITPGQSAVFYDDDYVIGGGRILQASKM